MYDNFFLIKTKTSGIIEFWLAYTKKVLVDQYISLMYVKDVDPNQKPSNVHHIGEIDFLL